jgi:hypothetical protein
MKERSGSSASPGYLPPVSVRHRHADVILAALVATAALAFTSPVIATAATTAATPDAAPATADAPVVLPPPPKPR